MAHRCYTRQMLGLTVFNTVCLIVIAFKVKQVEKSVSETELSLDGIKRLLTALFIKSRKNKDTD